MSAPTTLPSSYSGTIINRYGPLSEVLNLSKDVPLLSPSPTQVTVRVSYAAINPIDWKLAEGVFSQYFPLSFPYAPGFDLSGVVVAVGSAVNRLSVGDEVYADSAVGNGAFSEYVNVEAEEVSIKPRNVSFAVAAALPLAAETSLTALEKAGIKRGSRVVVIGAAGGTGAFGIQIAKALGASEVIAVASSRHDEYVKSIGADTVIDYTKTSLTQSGINNIDVVYDTIGGYWEDAKNLLAPHGKFVTIAFWEPAPASDQYASHLLTSSHTHLDRITAWVEQGLIKVHIEKEFPFTKEGVEGVYAYSKAGKTRGKAVIKISQ